MSKCNANIHAAGDHVLQSFAGLLTSKLRQRDTLARLGGDEFALLLEHTTIDQAYDIANELCECVRKFAPDLGGPRVCGQRQHRHQRAGRYRWQYCGRTVPRRFSLLRSQEKRP
ncbi:diguanylate cyclase [Methylomonas sp. EbA]|uniref:diguanylate cyclase n=1 Tax=Methylomonas albis TaxID=1854563 RepID=A0ABR9D0J3_9GAMM|nr:diguanylate cyclase [Methylomonas albis]